jgi:hypothetical protein
MKTVETSIFLFLLGLPGSSGPSINHNVTFIHLFSNSAGRHITCEVPRKGLVILDSRTQGQPPRKATLVPALGRSGLSLGVLALDACPGRESRVQFFPWNITPSPLNLLALERRRLIFLSGVDKGCCCPRERAFVT